MRFLAARGTSWPWKRIAHCEAGGSGESPFLVLCTVLSLWRLNEVLRRRGGSQAWWLGCCPSISAYPPFSALNLPLAPQMNQQVPPSGVAPLPLGPRAEDLARHEVTHLGVQEAPKGSLQLGDQGHSGLSPVPALNPNAGNS